MTKIEAMKYIADQQATPITPRAQIKPVYQRPDRTCFDFSVDVKTGNYTINQLDAYMRPLPAAEAL